MKKILLFGGTFDPPHNGHMHLLAESIRAVQPDLVLVMPTGIPPHKDGGHTPGEVRARMCRCFLPLLRGRVKIDGTELRRAGKSYTADTLRLLRRRYPGAQLYLPMGSDMLLYFKNWYQYRDILRMAALVVLCRDEDDEAPVRVFARALAAEGGRVLFAPGDVLEVSSTEIRAKAAAGESIRALVPPAVARIVEHRGLYKAPAGTSAQKDR